MSASISDGQLDAWLQWTGVTVHLSMFAPSRDETAVEQMQQAVRRLTARVRHLEVVARQENQ